MFSIFLIKKTFFVSDENLNKIFKKDDSKSNKKPLYDSDIEIKIKNYDFVRTKQERKTF